MNFILTLLFSFFAFPMISSASINLEAKKQKIDGFGGSNAFISSGFFSLTPILQLSLLETLFNTTTGLGLSIFRTRVPFDLLGDDGVTWNWNTWDLKATVKQINIIQQIYGPMAIFSTPSTPPAFMKTNNNIVQGSLKEEYYEAYAQYLADYVLGMKSRYNIDLAAISIVNEPDWLPTYESCTWNATQFHIFIRDHLGPVFRRNNVTAKLMFPEQYKYAEDLAIETLNDPEATKYVDIIGTHQYGIPKGSNFTDAKKQNKTIWMTEHSISVPTYDGSMTNALKWAKEIHNDFAQTEINAYCYFWLYCTSMVKNNVLVSINNTDLVISKRTWAIGQYSRFIRPGFYRVQSDTNPLVNVSMTAYVSPNGKLVTVIINENSYDQILPIEFSRNVISLDLYRTSETEDLKFIESKSVNAMSTKIELRAQSVNTLLEK